VGTRAGGQAVKAIERMSLGELYRVVDDPAYSSQLPEIYDRIAELEAEEADVEG
jgi:hypothetical protein